MKETIYDKNDVYNINWEEDCFKYCEFKDISLEGEHITADFSSCTFQNVELYWGIFNIVNFVDCKFINCVFKGTSFSDCKFVECELSHCYFIKDNINGDCTFERTISYNSKLKSCKGFNVKLR